MTDPRRLLAGDATDFERLLLGAADRERPSRLQRGRMRRALILAELGVLTASAKAIAAFAGNVIVVAVVASTLAGGSSSSPTVPAYDSSQSVTKATARQAAVSLPSKASSSIVQAVPEPYDATAEHLPLAEESLVEPRTVGRSRTEAALRRLPALSQEIALMDQARTALRSGSPEKALALLGQYRTQFPQGSFGQEVTVLRIESLATSGNRNQAIAEANSFLEMQPNSPHAERLRRVIGRNPAR